MNDKVKVFLSKAGEYLQVMFSRQYFKRLTISLENIIRYDNPEGNRMPPWYYGCACMEITQAIKVYYVIPINYIFRAFRFVQWKWDTFRGKPSWIDEYAAKCYQEGYAKGVERGAQNLVDGIIQDMESRRKEREAIKLTEKKG
jgi:hypothetical protein